MSTVLTPTSIQDMPCQVVHNRRVGAGLMVLRLRPLAVGNIPGRFECTPGQFVMLDLPVETFHFRRPFSVLETHDGCDFDIYYKVVGKGTQLMQKFRPGERMQCLGPLGKGFTPPKSPETALYIGGGIGIAPLYLLQKRLEKTGWCYYGTRTQAEIGLEYELLDVFGEKNLFLATDDGSSGFQGNVCELLSTQTVRILNAREAYVCGPTPMMEAAVTLLHSINPGIRIEVSLEEHMPCGTGACTGCVVPRTDQLLPSKVCQEGPVFNARAIRWRWDATIPPYSTTGMTPPFSDQADHAPPYGDGDQAGNAPPKGGASGEAACPS